MPDSNMVRSYAGLRIEHAFGTVRTMAGSTSERYAELHCHTNFSFLDGASHPEELAVEAARLGLAGLAVTDHHGLYGVVRFALPAPQHALPTVFGAEMTLLEQRAPAGSVSRPAASATRH